MPEKSLSSPVAPSRSVWPFRIEGQLRMVPVRCRLRANDVPTIRAAALAGLGIAHLPSIAVTDDLRRGCLQRVLQPFSPEVGGIHVVYPHARLLAPKVTQFVAMALASTR